MPEDMDLFLEYQRKDFPDPRQAILRAEVEEEGGRSLVVGLDSVAVEAPDGKLTRMRLALSDITERKRSEEALKASEKRLQDLSSKLLSLQEMERKVIANEIHDGLLSDLAAVNSVWKQRLSTLEKVR